jgi:hypothetical protein
MRATVFPALILALSGFILGGVAASPAAQATTILQNGSFEDGTFVNNTGDADTVNLANGATAITGWTVVSNAVAWIGAGNTFGLAASDGNRFLDLTAYHDTSPNGGVSQTFNTVAGTQYAVSFDLGHSQTYNGSNANGVSVSAAGQSHAYLTSLNAGLTWESFVFMFVASASSTTLSFIGSQGTVFVGLDNIAVATVAQTPIPAALPMFATALAGLGALRARRRKAAR